MTTVTVLRNRDKSYSKISVIGHAGFGGYFKKDIVCAAISILVINTVNSLEVLAGYKPTVFEDEKKGIIEMSFDEPMSDEAKLLVKSMLLGIQNISAAYEKYCRLIYKEEQDHDEA